MFAAGSLGWMFGIGTAIVLARFHSYLFFHALAETYSTVVAAGVFMVGWHARRIHRNGFITFIGLAFAAAALIDCIHALAYFGMGVFRDGGKNLPTQLWIAGRVMLVVPVAAAPWFVNRRVRAAAGLFALATAAFLAGIFLWKVFPDCYVEGQGLTPFKIASEYAICAAAVCGAAFWWSRRERIDRRVLLLFLGFFAATILQELAFTLYAHVYDAFNMAGHLLKIAACYLAYRAVVVIGIEEPYSIVFRGMKERERSLEQALAEVRTLRGILPICASCKKIRDDAGFWQAVEDYLWQHSEARFSHGICPDCAASQRGDLRPR